MSYSRIFSLCLRLGHTPFGHNIPDWKQPRGLMSMAYQIGTTDDAAPRNRACDFCFEKKIKCDREDPCANCLAATVDCLRKRPKRRIRHAAYVRNPPSSRITSHNSKITPRQVLEGHSAIFQERSEPGLDSEENVPKDTPASQNSKQKSTCSSTTETGPAAAQAHSHIGSELESRIGLDAGKREVLRAALAFANQASQQPGVGAFGEDTGESFDAFSETSYPTAESLYLILSSPRQSVGQAFTMDIGSVISEETLERQALGLIEQSVNGAARIHCIVNVNFFVWMYLGASNFQTTGSAMARHLLLRRQQYEKNLRAALCRIGVLDQPSLPLLQALLSGAMFMLLSGKLEMCWQLSASASRICMALGGPRRISSQTMASHELRETRYTLSICYIFDRALALSMNRCLSLPEFDINPTELVPTDAEKPYTSLIQVFLQLAEVQSNVVQHAKTKNVMENVETVQKLQGKMWKIKETCQKQPLHTKEKYLQAEWMGVDFVYHSVMTSIVKLHPYLLDDAGLHQQLLGYARTSLSSLSEMLGLAKTLVDFHLFRVSVSWLILLYPIYPFFVIFTHTVNTTSLQDYRLITQVTTSLCEFAGHNPALMGVQKLFEEFVKLCTPIFDKNKSIDIASPALLETRGSSPQRTGSQLHHNRMSQGLSGPPEQGTMRSAESHFPT
ncbi:hypothetical protein BDP55DRAFT_715536 [Colletotrichum godetiae]|uniref:Zn(2)-C6 fungal-type domain-containing protein n=1 Tax=Colletotrichum godetiae TaxID=1209918 RepID=A0AAJ0AK64_9PEZI|nr:uncharacterized protein BDP55DRAFT_715536 [Colletotrichum godetiae]KAK1675372.1 hypothetical protein BDP55DRAFT_715536 [Colletotrichum godetiae]